MRILRTVLEDIESQAHRSLPRECCGILLAAADGPVVTHALEADNATGSRTSQSYVLGHRAHIRAVEAEVRGSGCIVGYYHSHPGGGACPSSRDVAEAVRGVVYLITALDNDSVRHAAWRLEGGEMIAEPLQADEDRTIDQDCSAEG